ncbi:hypothetical protein JHK87_011246 [Glycine soja]|nr:hypothetical protein JHK87_011246 [Glycine soja]
MWSDPWLRFEGNPYIETPIVQGAEKLVVANIVDIATGTWNLMHGRLKCNVDAAFLKETNSTGFGLRLRDPQVRMVVLRSCCVKPCMQFVEVEAYGLMLALQFVSNL